MDMKRFGVCGMALLLTTVGLRGAGPEALLADAAEKMDRAAIRTLLQQRVDVNTSQVDGMTALHWAPTRTISKPSSCWCAPAPT